MKDNPWVFCCRNEPHAAHGTTCPGTGICADNDDHLPHMVLTGSLAPYWCLADWTLRQPYKGEQEQKRRQAATREARLDALADERDRQRRRAGTAKYGETVRRYDAQEHESDEMLLTHPHRRTETVDLLAVAAERAESQR